MIDSANIENVLDFYKCPCKVAGVREGGGFIDYFLQPMNGTTINKLQARVNDFSGAIGQAVSIAFEQMTIIFRVSENERPVYNFFNYNAKNLDKIAGNIGIGLNPWKNYVQYNLFEMPHLLVAGATGSGKSVFLHNAIISLLANGGVCLRLIDLKRVELSMYNGLKEMSSDCITDAQTAAAVLEWEVNEMNTRYELMERYQVRNYKQLPPEKALTARVIVIDELCDLMLNRETRKSVENSIVRIAQLGRAAGCHLIVATQRPSTNVITGLIKANIPCKLSFMTSNATDSRVIGCKGAENLSGRGDGLLSIAGKQELERVQAFYISDSDLEQYLKIKRENQAKATTPPPKPRKRGFFTRLFA